MNTFPLTDKEGQFHANTVTAEELILSLSQYLSLQISFTTISSRSMTPI